MLAEQIYRHLAPIKIAESLFSACQRRQPWLAQVHLLDAFFSNLLGELL
jgi:hypothetical protein